MAARHGRRDRSHVHVIADRAEEEAYLSLLTTLAIEDAAMVLLWSCSEDTAPRAPRLSSPRSVPSLLSTLPIEDAAVAAAATAVVLLGGHGRGVLHMMHASPCLLSFTMVQALHSHDGAILLIGGGD